MPETRNNVALAGVGNGSGAQRAAGTSTSQRIAAGWSELSPSLRTSRPDLSVRPRDSEGRLLGGVEVEADAPPEAYLPRYRPSVLIGRGGMGLVWSARQEALGRDVALKVAHARLGDRQRTQFQVEAACTAWLEHPNIVPIYDAGPEFIVMKRIEGDTLERLLSLDRLRPPAIVDILIKVCDAVAFAHSRGIIHRDIKPENIMVGRFGEVVLMDWGLALQVGETGGGPPRAPLKTPGRALCAGTPGYMAPEMAHADANDISYATDVFLLGATLYRCLTGQLPFDGADALEALDRSGRNEWTPVLALAPTAPPRLVAIQERAMATPVDDRPTIGDMQSLLRDWLMSANAEAEAQRCHGRGLELLQVARSAGNRSDEAYAAYSEALNYLDQAVTLCPDHGGYDRSRGEVLREFAWAAAAAGEPGLARLLKRSGRLLGHQGRVHDHPPDQADTRNHERMQLRNSLDLARRHLEQLGNRCSELEARVERANTALSYWGLFGSMLVIVGAVVAVTVVLAFLA